MNADPIRQLLRQADEMAAPPPDGPADMPHRVRSLARRRRAAGTALVCAGAVCLAGIAWHFLLPAARPGGTAPVAEQTPDMQPPQSPARPELADCGQEIRLHQMIAAQMLELEESRDIQRKLAGKASGRQADIADQLDQAACTMMLLAAAQERQQKDPQAAARTYRLVIDDFGQTLWARVARERLTRLEQGSSCPPRPEDLSLRNAITGDRT